jgi:chromosome partitioning protein
VTCVVQVLSTKGGVGKSTTAVVLADALAQDGKAVHLVDAGEQGTSARWMARWDAEREVRPRLRSPAVTYANVPWRQLAAQLDALRRGGAYEVVVVDTPGGAEESDWAARLSALEQADVGLLVLRAAKADLDEMGRALKRLAAHARDTQLATKLGVLLTQGRSALLVDEIRAALETAGAVVLETVVPASSTWERRYGEPPVAEMTAVGRNVAAELGLLD